jgi:hypothetical protein
MYGLIKIDCSIFPAYYLYFHKVLKPFGFQWPDGQMGVRRVHLLLPVRNTISENTIHKCFVFPTCVLVRRQSTIA